MKKPKIRLTQEAEQDLSNIYEYISEELKSPEAAVNTVLKIIKSYEKLAEFPEAGADISSFIGIKTDYRRLVCGNYSVFYKFDGAYVSIYRILNSRIDCIRLLFNLTPEFS